MQLGESLKALVPRLAVTFDGVELKFRCALDFQIHAAHALSKTSG